MSKKSKILEQIGSYILQVKNSGQFELHMFDRHLSIDDGIVFVMLSLGQCLMAYNPRHAFLLFSFHYIFRWHIVEAVYQTSDFWWRRHARVQISKDDMLSHICKKMVRWNRFAPIGYEWGVSISAKIYRKFQTRILFF